MLYETNAGFSRCSIFLTLWQQDNWPSPRIYLCDTALRNFKNYSAVFMALLKGNLKRSELSGSLSTTSLSKHSLSQNPYCTDQYCTDWHWSTGQTYKTQDQYLHKLVTQRSISLVDDFSTKPMWKITPGKTSIRMNINGILTWITIKTNKS